MENSVTINARHLLGLYAERKYDELSDRFLEVLAYFDKTTYLKLSPDESHFINSFCDIFLCLFCKEDYDISPQHVFRFLGCGPVICNIVAISDFRNTDPQLEILRQQKNNLVKILCLLSPRSAARFSIDEFFSVNPLLSSIWYSRYFEAVEGFPCQLEYENMRRHQASIDPRWAIQGVTSGGSSFPYSFATYVDHATDRAVKSHVNASLKPMFSAVTVRSRPNPRKIAIVTARWVRTSAVYRSCAKFVEALRPDYDLTLVQLGAPFTDFDRSIFSDVRSVRFNGSNLDLTPILENDFALAYFPDIGMQDEDRFLSNLRFAPIQVMGYGHPVSTFGGEIDYFIGGQAVERLDLSEDHYSERLVLVPGIGAVPTHPDYESRDPGRFTDAAIINCPWAAHKVNYPHLLTLRKISEELDRPVLFRFFAGQGLSRHNAFIPFVRDVQSVLGPENVEIFAEQPYREYMALMEQGAMAIDSFPFGGFNSIIDSLWLRKPVVALEGAQFINRASSALLRQIGMQELVAHDPDEYVALVVRLLGEESYRRDVVERIRGIDIEKMVFDPAYPQWFRKAIDFLIERHEALKAEHSNQPIFIN